MNVGDIITILEIPKDSLWYKVRINYKNKAVVVTKVFENRLGFSIVPSSVDGHRFFDFCEPYVKVVPIEEIAYLLVINYEIY